MMQFRTDRSLKSSLKPCSLTELAEFRHTFFQNVRSRLPLDSLQGRAVGACSTSKIENVVFQHDLWNPRSILLFFDYCTTLLIDRLHAIALDRAFL